MMNRFLRAALWIVAVPALLARAAAAVQVSQLLPFAGADNLRIEATVESDQDLGAVEVSGRIEPWGGGEAIWEDVLGQMPLKAGKPALLVRQIDGLKPQLWSLLTPNLYRLTVTARCGTESGRQTTRLGFRSFESKGGQFWLNGRRIYLRGNSINPPGRGVPEELGRSHAFAEAYIRDLKQRNVNLVRVDTDLWQDVCDEVGMLVFHGRYGGPRGGTKTAPPADLAAAVARYQQEYFDGYQKHPSVVISILSNEMPHRGSPGEAFGAFFDAAYAALRKWDPNRLYIGNAGFGGGRGGDINDAHPYWGWYGGDFLENYAKLARRGNARQLSQPWTFSECVGAYTTPEGEFSIQGKLLGTTLTWTGHCADQARAALQYQAFLAKEFIEIQRRSRPLNPNLAGIMPFTPIWFNWEGIGGFGDMKPKPVADQMAVSFQPVLLSWELWTAQAYAGANVRAVAHVVNDSDEGAELRDAKLVWRLLGPSGKEKAGGELVLPTVPYYEVRSLPIELTVPPGAEGSCRLIGQIVAAGRPISKNEAPLAVYPRALPRRPLGGRLRLYDPSGRTGAALGRLGIACESVSGRLDLAESSVPLVIGEGAWDENLSRQTERLQAFVRAGGRVLVLRPDPSSFVSGWLGAKVQAAPREGMWINLERPAHPAFAGLTHWQMQWWSDFSGWRQGDAGLPRIYPATVKFTLGSASDLERTAVLADYDTGLSAIALCEVFDGQGSVLLSGFGLVERSGIDPVADRLLGNLVKFVADKDGHEAYPFIDRSIVWGDYPTERGAVVGSQQGLLVNQDGTKRRGRRMLGPFSYGGPTHGYIVDPEPGATDGSGRFFVRIPPGKKMMLTTVENPASGDLRMQTTINGERTAQMVPAGRTAVMATPLPDSTVLDVSYAGSKRLILVATDFR